MSNNDVQKIKEDFSKVQPLLNVVGDETRQLILLVLMDAKCTEGMRVGEITEKTHLSRPAVSHQIRILKDLGLVTLRSEGTKNFYNIDIVNNRELLNNLKKLIYDIQNLINHLEENRCQNILT